MHRIALALVLAAAPAHQEPDPPAASPPPIRGVVVNEAGAPISHVRYWVSGFEQCTADGWQLTFFTGDTKMHYTDDRGHFELPGRADLRYDIDFDEPGYMPACAKQVEAGANLNVVMQVGLDLAGRVVQLEGQRERPAENARIHVRRSNARGLWFETQTRSDREGRFEFPGFLDPEGSSTWRLECAGATFEIDALPDEAVDDLLIEVRIRRGDD